jgi:hypothetical protein
VLWRSNLPRAAEDLAHARFVYRHASMGSWTAQTQTRDAVRDLFAGEKVRDDCLLPSPDADDSERIERFNVVKLASLVQMKLTSFRDKDRIHSRDMLDVELIDPS